MSEFENAIPNEEQELKDRTDAVISQVGKLSDEDLSQMAGGDDCTEWSSYGCSRVQCDNKSNHDCPTYFMCDSLMGA